MTAFGRPVGDFAPLFELLAEALPAFAVEEDEGPPLERILEGAGFTVELAEYRMVTETYPDMDTLVRGYLAIGPLRRAVRAIGEAEGRGPDADRVRLARPPRRQRQPHRRVPAAARARLTDPCSSPISRDTHSAPSARERKEVSPPSRLSCPLWTTSSRAGKPPLAWLLHG